MYETLFIFKYELIHILVTSLIALFLWWRFRNGWIVLVTFLVGIFIDIDHFFDYFSFFGFKLNIADFFNTITYIKPSGKVYVLLHGWEFLIVFGLVGYLLEKKTKIKGLKWSFFIPYLAHLICDNFSFQHHPLGYFFFYRLINNFSLEAFNG